MLCECEFECALCARFMCCVLCARARVRACFFRAMAGRCAHYNRAEPWADLLQDCAASPDESLPQVRPRLPPSHAPLAPSHRHVPRFGRDGAVALRGWVRAASASTPGGSQLGGRAGPGRAGPITGPIVAIPRTYRRPCGSWPGRAAEGPGEPPGPNHDAPRGQIMMPRAVNSRCPARSNHDAPRGQITMPRAVKHDAPRGPALGAGPGRR